MWLLKKTKQTLTRDKQPFRETEQFKSIQQLLKIEGNVLPISKLEQIAQTSFDQQICETLFQILSNKIQRYLNKKSKMIKMFKALVIVDYLLLNGASALVDLFNDSVTIFQKLKVSCLDGTPNFGAKDQQINDMVNIKATHIVQILKNKQKRLSQKLKLNQAKLLLKRDKYGASFHNTQDINALESTSQQIPEPDYPGSFLKKRPKAFQKIQKFMQKKLVKLTSALLGLIDPDYQISDDYLKNKQFMQRGESIIQDTQIIKNKQQMQQKQNHQKYNKQETKTKQQIAEDQRVRKIQQEIKKNENLLQLDHEFI